MRVAIMIGTLALGVAGCTASVGMPAPDEGVHVSTIGEREITSERGDRTTRVTIREHGVVLARAELAADGAGALQLEPERRSTPVKLDASLLADPGRTEKAVLEAWVLAVGSRAKQVPYDPHCYFTMTYTTGCSGIAGSCYDDGVACTSNTVCCGDICEDYSHCTYDQ